MSAKNSEFSGLVRNNFCKSKRAVVKTINEIDKGSLELLFSKSYRIHIIPYLHIDQKRKDKNENRRAQRTHAYEALGFLLEVRFNMMV